MTQDAVLFDTLAGQGGSLGIISLNRPSVLNSLNQAMVHAMHAKLLEWAADVSIKAVIIRAVEGRAFCAGGDLRLTYERAKHHDAALSSFFYDEYQLNRCIHHYPKPYIALMDGITMGGGVGISIHGTHRVATEKLMFAMPETGIGFFPDVGGTYFLPRLPGKLGYYLGLTGARLRAPDCVALGLTQHYVTSQALQAMITALANTQFGEHATDTVTQVIAEFHAPVPVSPLLASQNTLDSCFTKTTMEGIIAALQASTHQLCQEAATTLLTKSPTSLKVTLSALMRGLSLDFDTCMQQEYRLACHFTEGHDFLEGIRAVIIDKDQLPRWKPTTLAAVSLETVESYFTPTKTELNH